MKVTTTTSLEEQDFERIQKLAVADDSTTARILRKAVLIGLPLIERDVLGQEFVGGKALRKKQAA